MKLNAKQLRKSKQTTVDRLQLKKNDIYIILDNVLDTYNIGSIFRLADAVGAKKVYLCGNTSTPPDSRIKKSSINTTEWVEWEYAETTLEVIGKLRGMFSTPLEQYPSSDPPQVENREVTALQIIAIEQTAGSIQYDKFEYKLPLALIVGHETYGVSKEVLEVVDGVVEIPMFGVNVSLNVMVSLAIVLFKAIEKIKDWE